MIGRLRGMIAAIGEGQALIDVQGVGYLVYAGARSLARLSVGEVAELHVETQMSESQDVPTGPLIVTTTVGIGSTWLSSRLDEFLKLYPLIQLEIRLNDAELDLAMREADVAIRLHRPNQSEMIQRKLFTVHNHFYASKGYVEEYGMPSSADQLDDHRRWRRVYR